MLEPAGARMQSNAVRYIWALVLALWMVVAAPRLASAAPGKASFTATAAPSPVRPGEVARITITGTIEPTFHIYSSVPPTGEGPIATTVRVEGDGVETLGVSESAPKTKFDKGFGFEIGYHEEQVTFTAAVRVPQGAKPGALPLTVSVRYQACDESGCQPPKTQSVDVAPLTVEAGAVRAEFADAPPAPAVSVKTGAPGAAVSSAVVAAEADVQAMSWPTFLGWAFGAGLLALLTPCVFPMIPVTFSYFTKLATGSPNASGSKTAAPGAQAGIVRLALLYCAGIVLSFTVLGIGLAVFVGAAGANRLATNPIVNVIFGVLFVVFGLALLEVFELRLPQKLQNLSGAGRQKGGAIGVFLMGLTFVISAFTCAAPFLGTVMVAAANAGGSGALLRPILGMSTFALALALPFALLALFPSLLARLPRSGGWLTTVKGAMGFLELVAAVKFLSNADLVWNARILTLPAVLALWAIALLGGGLWLLGILRLGHNTPEPPATPARRVWSGVFIAAAIYCLYGLTDRPLGRFIDALLPPEDYGAARASTASGGGLSWLTKLDAAKAQARAEHKRIFIDFTGHACTNCRLVEKYVFPTPAVKAELGRFVRLQLHTDAGNAEEDANQEYQLKSFGTVTTPLYAILEADGTVVAHTDYNLARDENKFAAWLKAQQAPAVASGTP